jgi:hypothetical protein
MNIDQQRLDLRLREMVEILAIEIGDQGGFLSDERLLDPTDVMGYLFQLDQPQPHRR